MTQPNLITIEIRPAEKVNGTNSAFILSPYDNDLVNAIREIRSRHWHPERKLWEIPVTQLEALMPALLATRFEIELTGHYSEAAASSAIPKEFQFKTKPFQHQIVGFQYGLQHDQFLLGDEQGLGKTKQAIDIAVAKKISKGYKHCLIVCGVNGTKWNWESEVRIHSNEKAYLIGSRTKGKGRTIVGSTKDKLDDLKKLPDAYFLILNVEALRNEAINKQVKLLCDLKVIQMIVIDEIHKCKNPTSQQTKGILKLQAESMIGMTGTPLMNNPLDLFVPLRWLGFEKHSFYQYKNHYCEMGGFGGHEVIGYRNLGELRSSLELLMLRRLKKEVLDLPAKLYQTEYVEMTAEQLRIYQDVKAQILENIDRIRLSPNPLAQLIRLRQATGFTGILSSEIQASAKLDRLEELVEDLVANGEKCLVFSNWTDMTKPTAQRLARFSPALITGEVSDRVAEQNRFMTDPKCKVLIGTVGAMGTGLTLTAATTVIFLDSPWNRATKEQAEDRAHRIGTKSNVTIITLVCKDTIDERIEELIEKKGRMSDILVDGKITGDPKEVLDYLLA